MPERYLGQTLGKYRIDAVIGSGGFAWVYKAYDPELDIPLAIKILKPQYAGDEKFETRFRREASTAARLRHPNIIKIFSVGKERDAVYFAMDYLPQGLHDRLDVMTTLPEPMLIRLGIDVASALGFAHREGVIHRDIKVDNILFDEHGNAVVADFGIARAVSNYAEVTGTNMVVGTPQYFAPEQARGQTLDGRADLYSLGVTLFRAATGSLPFTGEDWYEIARQHVEDRPPKPRALNPSLSRELEEIILKCLAKEPDNRFESGEQLCTALATLLQERGESVAMHTRVVPPTDTARSPAAHTGRRRQRSRRYVAAAGAAALVLATSALVLRSRRQESHPAVSTSTRASPPGRATQSGAVGTNASTGPSVVVPDERRVLAIISPPAATLTLDGARLPSGASWESDTLRAGKHVLLATVKTIDGCPSARERKAIDLAERGRQEIKLTLRPCGTLSLTSRTPGTQYTVTAGATSQPRTGPLSRPKLLVLPVGSYKVQISKPFCVEFNQDVQIAAGRGEFLAPILFCQK